MWILSKKHRVVCPVVMSVCVAASVQLWCLHEQTVFFPLGTLIYCSGTFAATSMIYLWPGSNESFDTRWMRRTWAASALLCSIGPLSVQSHYDKWCSLLPWRRGSQIFTREVYLNIFNADCISSLVFSFFLNQTPLNLHISQQWDAVVEFIV